MGAINVMIETIKRLQEATYEKRFVGFVDILGYSDRVRRSKAPFDLSLLISIMKMYENSANIGNRLKVQYFSDCMYVTAEQEHVNELFDFLAKLYNQLLNSSLTIYAGRNSDDEYGKDNEFLTLLRGGITFGDVYVLDQEKNKGSEEALILPSVMVGPAMVVAYMLESKISKYPRILVDASACEKLKKAESIEFIKNDFDGEYYFDFLCYLKQKSEFEEGEKRMVRKVADYLNKHHDKSDYGVREKYGWMMKYLMTYM